MFKTARPSRLGAIALVLGLIVTLAAASPSGAAERVEPGDDVYAFGATYHGSAGDIDLNEPIMSMTPTASGNGYWLGAFDGGVFTYGDAQFHGSAGDIELNQPITGMTATQDVRATGRCLYPDGTRIYRYLADVGTETLIAQAVEGSDPTFDVARRELDNTMLSLELDV